MVEVLTREVPSVELKPADTQVQTHNEAVFKGVSVPQVYARVEEPLFHRAKRPPTAEEKRAARLQAHDAKLVSFAERIDAIAEIQEGMEEAIQKNPDVTPGELFLIAQKAKGRVKEEDLAVAHEAAKIYQKRHEAVEWARKEYPDNSELFTALFGKLPHGKIEIVKGPMTLSIKCENRIDYANAHVELDVDETDTTEGVFLKVTPFLHELRGCLTVENLSIIKPGTGDDVSEHEGQHAKFDLFEEAYLKFTDLLGDKVPANYFHSLSGFDVEFDTDDVSKIVKDLQFCNNRRPEDRAFTQDMVNDRKMHVLKSHLRDKREGIEEATKNEVLAFLKEPNSDLDVIFVLMSVDKQEGGYNIFTDEKRSQMAQMLETRVGLDGLEFVESAVESVFFTEWRRILGKSLDAIEHLQRMGYTQDECVKMLMTQPFRNWPKVVRRIDQGRNIEMQRIMENAPRRDAELTPVALARQYDLEM